MTDKKLQDAIQRKFERMSLRKRFVAWIRNDWVYGNVTIDTGVFEKKPQPGVARRRYRGGPVEFQLLSGAWYPMHSYWWPKFETS